VAVGRCAKCDDPAVGYPHLRGLYTAAPEYREQMLRAHFPYTCGPGGEMVRERNGYWYPVEYIADCVREGAGVFLDEQGWRRVNRYLGRTEGT
jgi:hypothetical protein